MSDLFSNGTEYEAFLETECADCPHYVYFEEATREKPVCEIEERIALCSMNPNVKPPLEWLDENEFLHRYDCRKKAGKGRKT